MLKKIWHVLLSLVLAGCLLLFIYLIFASFEGQSLDQKSPVVTPPTTNQTAQKLLVGDYAIFTTVSKTDSGYQLGCWRYLLGLDSLVEFYKMDFPNLNEVPIVEQFSNESISIHWRDDHTLVHINGEVIGPAESHQAIISPDRNWLAYSDFTPINQASIFLKNIVDNQSLVVITNGSENKEPNRDNFSVLAWSADSQVLYVKDKQKLYKFFPAQLDIEELTSLTALQTENYFIQPGEKFVTAITADNNQNNLYMIDIDRDSSSYVLSNSNEPMVNAFYNQPTNKISFTLGSLNPRVWQINNSHPQVLDQKFLFHGLLLAWPEKDQFIFQRNQDIYFYSTQAGNEQMIFAADNLPSLVEIDFLDMFKIQ